LDPGEAAVPGKLKAKNSKLETIQLPADSLDANMHYANCNGSETMAKMGKLLPKQ